MNPLPAKPTADQSHYIPKCARENHHSTVGGITQQKKKASQIRGLHALTLECHPSPRGVNPDRSHPHTQHREHPIPRSRSSHLGVGVLFLASTVQGTPPSSRLSLPAMAGATISEDPYSTNAQVRMSSPMCLTRRITEVMSPYWENCSTVVVPPTPANEKKTDGQQHIRDANARERKKTQEKRQFSSQRAVGQTQHGQRARQQQEQGVCYYCSPKKDTKHSGAVGKQQGQGRSR